MIEEHEQEYSEQYEDGFKTVLKFFSAENEKQCERNLYKYTSCGAWIEFKDWGIRLGSIVEGSDEGTDVFELKYDEDYTEFTEMENFLILLLVKLNKKFMKKSSYIGTSGDDGWFEFTSNVIARGEEYYNNITKEEMRELYRSDKCNDGFLTDFPYCHPWHLLQNDLAYAKKAHIISAMTKDISEILPKYAEQLTTQITPKKSASVIYHPPCTLQHGQQLKGGVEKHLGDLGFQIKVTANESHLCCGSAGTYSVLNPDLSKQLRDRKLGHLNEMQPSAILSANIGCITHLQSGTQVPVRHWVEVVDAALAP